jgi:hypothetical protein
MASGAVRRTDRSEYDQQQENDESISTVDTSAPTSVEAADQFDDLTRSFIRLSNLPTYPLDRLSRYEARLWRQACQIPVCAPAPGSTKAMGLHAD